MQWKLYQVRLAWKKQKKSAYVTFYSLNTVFFCYGKNVKPKFGFMKFLANFNFRKEEFFQYHTFFNLMIQVLAIIVHKMYNIAR